jgi:thioredoxin 1
MSNVSPVTDAEFEVTVLQSEQPVLVDFWAEWCGPCRMIAPIVEDIAGEFAGKAKVVKMDTDANPRTPMSLGIMSIPTVILFKGGRPVERTVGYRPSMKGDLKEKLTALL